MVKTSGKNYIGGIEVLQLFDGQIPHEICLNDQRIFLECADKSHRCSSYWLPKGCDNRMTKKWCPSSCGLCADGRNSYYLVS